MPVSDRLKDLIRLLVIEPDLNDPRVQKAQKSDEVVRKLTILCVLVFGALTPIFVEKSYAPYVGFVSVGILAVLAGITLFKR